MRLSNEYGKNTTKDAFLCLTYFKTCRSILVSCG